MLLRGKFGYLFGNQCWLTVRASQRTQAGASLIFDSVYFEMNTAFASCCVMLWKDAASSALSSAM